MRRRRTGPASRRSFAGFTLIELGITIAVTAIFLSLTFSSLSFRRDFWILREQSFTLTKEIQRLRELSFQGLAVANRRVCAVGFLVSSLTPTAGVTPKKLLGVAATTITPDCLLVRQANLNLTAITNPETDPTVVKVTPMFGFTSTAGPYLSRIFATTTLTVEVNAVPLSFTTFELVFRNPYGEPVAFVDGVPLDTRIAPLRWSTVTFRVQLKDEQAAISVSRTGQLLLR